MASTGSCAGELTIDATGLQCPTPSKACCPFSLVRCFAGQSEARRVCEFVVLEQQMSRLLANCTQKYGNLVSAYWIWTVRTSLADASNSFSCPSTPVNLLPMNFSASSMYMDPADNKDSDRHWRSSRRIPPILTKISQGRGGGIDSDLPVHSQGIQVHQP